MENNQLQAKQVGRNLSVKQDFSNGNILLELENVFAVPNQPISQTNKTAILIQDRNQMGHQGINSLINILQSLLDTNTGGADDPIGSFTNEDSAERIKEVLGEN